MTEEKQEVLEESQVQETQEVQDKVEDVPEQKIAQKDDQKINWERANEALRIQQQKIAELEAKLSQTAKPVQEEKDEFADLDPEDYLTVGKAKSMAEKLAEKKATEAAKKIVEEYKQQQTLQQDETLARSKYDDYDFVIENYAIPAIKNNPALAYQIQQSRNPALTAYKIGKLSDEYEESNMKQQTSPKAEKVLKNTSRPVSGNAVGTPLKTQADQFSKMSKSEIWAQAEKYARGA
jgi:hypothetical protein